MNARTVKARITERILPIVAASLLAPAALAQGTLITYQGVLSTGGSPANGLYDCTFQVYDAATGGNPVGPSVATNAVSVSQGLFTVNLDFGSSVFTGSSRWLQIAVKSNGVAGSPTTLNPRQPLTAAPYAITSGNLTGTLSASQLTGTLPSALLSGTYSGALTFSSGGNLFYGNGGALTNVNAASLGGWPASGFWQTYGNIGTTAAQFLGTIDNKALTVKVNNTIALQFVPGTTLPNVVGGLAGYHPSVLASGVSGAVIAGGNAPSGGVTGVGGGDFQAVYDDDGTIGGGFGNKVGSNNGDLTDAAFATVAGGVFNGASGYAAAVGGGDSNLSGGSRSAVGGGAYNRALGDQSVVAGGSGNLANNPGTFVGGGNNNTALYYNTAVVGGFGNLAVQNYSAIGGGLFNTNQSLGGFIGGGYTNYAEGAYATVGGGSLGQTRSDFTTIGGGFSNVIGTNAQSATIAGGESNGSEAIRSTIGGGWLNAIGVAAWESVLAGGSINTIRSNAPFSVLSGGRQNLIGAGASYGIIPGGTFNEVNASLSLAAGNRAKANHAGSFVWADSQNADFASSAANQFSVRAAGGAVFSLGNAGLQVQGSALVSKAATTRATARQFAISHTGDSNWGLNLGYVFNAGVEAAGVIQALDAGNPTWLHINPAGGQVLLGSGSDVSWGDHYFSKLTADQGGSIEVGNSLLLSATPYIDFHYGVNGVQDFNVRLVNDGDNQLTCSGNFRALTFNTTSDRDAKENFKPVDARAVLDKVTALPLSEWNFKTETVTRHLGPMAQDFYTAFSVGTDDKHIATVDADGVALAAIQGLNQKLEDKLAMQAAEISTRDAQLKAQQQLISDLVNRVSALERKLNPKNSNEP